MYDIERREHGGSQAALTASVSHGRPPKPASVGLCDAPCPPKRSYTCHRPNPSATSFPQEVGKHDAAHWRPRSIRVGVLKAHRAFKGVNS